MPAEALERVARVDDVPAGGVLGVATARGERVCLVRLGDDVLAVSDTCTHQAFPLSAGAVTAAGTIQCAWHGAEFDCRTGTVRVGPAIEALRVYRVRVVDGDVYVGSLAHR